MKSTIKYLRAGLQLSWKHPVLIAVILTWLFLQGFVLDRSFLKNKPEGNWLTPALLIFFLLDNYLSCCVYFALKEYLLTDNLPVYSCWREGRRFFSPVLFFKLFVGVSGIFLISVVTSTLTVVSGASLSVFSFVLLLVGIWTAAGIYLLLTTLLTPLLIILGRSAFFPAVELSFRLVRHHLSTLIILVSLLGLPWVLVIGASRLYNIQGSAVLSKKVLTALAFGYLEIVTVQSLLAFLKEQLHAGSREERNNYERDT